MILPPSTPRWQYRFNNYQKAFGLLQAAVSLGQTRALTDLEKEGIVQRFEYTWELAWKLLKDYLEHNGVVLDTITPSAVIKAAFAAKLITQAAIWLQALDARNKMSHTYDTKILEDSIAFISDTGLNCLSNLQNYKILL